MRIFLILLFVYLHIASIAQSVLPNVASGKIIRIENFQSKYVTPRNIDVWLPDNYSEGQFYDVLYLHDGQMLFDSANTWNKQEWGVDETMQRLIDENKINATIVAGIWNYGKYRHSEYFPQVFLDDLREDFKKEFLNTWLQNIPQSDNYLKFITDELMPILKLILV